MKGVLSCCNPNCSTHFGFINSLESLLSCIYLASRRVLTSLSQHKIPGWNSLLNEAQKEQPISGKGLAGSCFSQFRCHQQIKKQGKSRFKYLVRRQKRRSELMCIEQLLSAFLKSSSCDFWNMVKRHRNTKSNFVLL